MEEFGISNLVATLGLTLFIAGLGLGPRKSRKLSLESMPPFVAVFLGPLSEFFGRNPVGTSHTLACTI